jgi:uncharacterized membrane protein YidH (DUF202 family)
VLADRIDATSPGTAATLHAAIALVCAGVIVPSLILVLLSGMLLVVARPFLIGARWVWLKAALGVLVAAVVFARLQPAITAATSMSEAGAPVSVATGPIDTLVATEFGAAAWTLALVVVAMIVAIWRPRLGRPRVERED